MRCAVPLFVALLNACSSSPEGAEDTGPLDPGIVLEDGEVWRLDVSGDVEGELYGDIAYVFRSGGDLQMSFGGLALGMVVSIPTDEVGATGVFDDAAGSFYATLETWDCNDYDGGETSITMTVNEVDRVAGTIEGSWTCDNPEGAAVVVSGRFDYSGTIDTDG